MLINEYIEATRIHCQTSRLYPWPYEDMVDELWPQRYATKYKPNLHTVISTACKSEYKRIHGVPYLIIDRYLSKLAARVVRIYYANHSQEELTFALVLEYLAINSFVREKYQAAWICVLLRAQCINSSLDSETGPFEVPALEDAKRLLVVTALERYVLAHELAHHILYIDPEIVDRRAPAIRKSLDTREFFFLTLRERFPEMEAGQLSRLHDDLIEESVCDDLATTMVLDSRSWNEPSIPLAAEAICMGHQIFRFVLHLETLLKQFLEFRWGAEARIGLEFPDLLQMQFRQFRSRSVIVSEITKRTDLVPESDILEHIARTKSKYEELLEMSCTFHVPLMLKGAEDLVTIAEEQKDNVSGLAGFIDETTGWSFPDIF